MIECGLLCDSDKLLYQPSLYIYGRSLQRHKPLRPRRAPLSVHCQHPCPCTVSTPLRTMFKALSVESVNAANGNRLVKAANGRSRIPLPPLSRSISERLGVRKVYVQPSHIGTRSHPCMGLNKKKSRCGTKIRKSTYGTK